MSATLEVKIKQALRYCSMKRLMDDPAVLRIEVSHVKGEEEYRVIMTDWVHGAGATLDESLSDALEKSARKLREDAERHDQAAEDERERAEYLRRFAEEVLAAAPAKPEPPKVRYRREGEQP